MISEPTEEVEFGEKYEWGDLFYEFPAETRLTVHRRLDMVN